MEINIPVDDIKNLFDSNLKIMNSLRTMRIRDIDDRTKEEKVEISNKQKMLLLKFRENIIKQREIFSLVFKEFYGLFDEVTSDVVESFPDEKEISSVYETVEYLRSFGPINDGMIEGMLKEVDLRISSLDVEPFDFKDFLKEIRTNQNSITRKNLYFLRDLLVKHLNAFDRLLDRQSRSGISIKSQRTQKILGVIGLVGTLITYYMNGEESAMRLITVLVTVYVLSSSMTIDDERGIINQIRAQLPDFKEFLKDLSFD